ncbi:MAG: RagB/SusD family nutrient uptake outer membrane protein [Bacteroidota bacterium]
MKKLFIFLLAVSMFFGIYSCQKTFLQIPNTSGQASLTTVYSSSQNALSALFQQYHNVLAQGWAITNIGVGFGHGNLGGISGENFRGSSWHGTYAITNNGLITTSFDGAEAGADNFSGNFSFVRGAYLVAENIDQVPDMDATNKAYVKAEVAGLVAYRYMGMFIRYGGMPIVTKSFLPTDNLAVPRNTLQETLDFTNKMADQAIAGLPDKWPPNSTNNDQTGRLTKGVALCIKAKVAMYAARPLFNSATPYLDFGTNNKLICFGTADAARWQTVITTNLAVLTWAQANGYTIINTGGAGVGAPNPNAFVDYATATSTPNNPEVILAYKDDNTANGDVATTSKWYNMSAYFTSNNYDTEYVGMTSNFLPNYYKADGTEQSWPQVGDAARPMSDYMTRIPQMEPRFLADHSFIGFGAANNPSVSQWSATGWPHDISSVTPGGSVAHGDGIPTKFYYLAGSRLWFEPPLFRLAETYLNLAEAYNEVGDAANALKYLNVIHNRAGLPSITQTDKTLLRAIIQREWAVEYYNESHRYYDVKHWKLANIGNGIIGGNIAEWRFNGNGASPRNSATNLISYYTANTYVGYWAPKMFLEPIPQTEVNKGIMLQNPGY